MRTDKSWLKISVASENNGSQTLPTAALRRRFVTALSVLFLGLAALSFPMAFYFFSGGFTGQVLVSVIALLVATYALSNSLRGLTEAAARIQTILIMGSALALTLADPGLVDFGLALFALGIVHMELLVWHRRKRNITRLSVSVLAFSVAGTASFLTLMSGPMNSFSLAGALICAVLFVALSHIALRLLKNEKLYLVSQSKTIRHLVDHLGDGYLRFSRDGQVVFASRTIESLLGAPCYEMTGSGFSDRVHVLDRPLFMTGFSEVVHTGASRTVEIRVRKDDAAGKTHVPEFVWVELFFSPISDVELGETKLEVVALLRNIARRKRHEIEMEAARELAEEASRTKSRFLATIGHELRTPLNAIVGFSEMMASGIGGELAETHKEYTNHIQQSGHHLLDIVTTLLDMSRIEAGKFELNLASFNPSALVQPCLNMVENAADKQTIRLRTDISKSLPPILADERACRQILINLLSNAIKFSAQGDEVNLVIRRQGENIAFCITDRGIGMSTESTKRVGEPFFQANGDLSRRYEGAGLGLSIVKGLVHLHQGTMKIQSTLGKGTTVTVFLPVRGPQLPVPDTMPIAPLPQLSPKTKTLPWSEQKSAAR